MSYCVNCGVELDPSCTVCPLCHTEVINPHEQAAPTSAAPYPGVRGHSDPVNRRDTAILMAVSLATTAIVCGILNLFIFTEFHWALYVIGVCIILWIFSLPVFFPVRMNPYISLLLDGLGVGFYFAIIAWVHPGNGWYWAIAVPLIALGTLLLEIFFFCAHHPRSSILSLAVILIAEITVMTICIELLVRHYRALPPALTWSAIVLTCAIIIDVTLITILRRTRLREEVRRRMHI